MQPIIAELLMQSRSKQHIDRVAQLIGSDHDRLAELVTILQGDNAKLAEYAGWAVGTIGQDHPSYFEPWYPELVAMLRRSDVHDAIPRNILRTFREAKHLPDEILGDLADCCFGFLDDHDAAIAIRAFSIHVLYSICQKEPELIPEFKLLLEQHIPTGSAGLKSIGRKALKKLG